jgi:hypothetical protein
MLRFNIGTYSKPNGDPDIISDTGPYSYANCCSINSTDTITYSRTNCGTHR